MSAMEASELRHQLEAAVAAHKALLDEYQGVSKDAAARKTEVMLLTAEVSSLRERLQVEARRRTDEVAHSSQEVEQLQHTVKQLREQLKQASAQPTPTLMHSLTPIRKASDLTEGPLPPSSAALHAAGTSTSSLEHGASADISALQARLSASEGELRSAMAAVTRLQGELDAERRSSADVRNRFADETQRMLKDALNHNEAALSTLVTDLNKSRQEAEQRWATERAQLEIRAKEARDELHAAQQLHQREHERSTDQIMQLMAAARKLENQRDELLNEKQHQMEINSELQSEKSSLASELNTLRAALQAGRLVPTSTPSLKPPATNSSHFGHTASVGARVPAESADAALAADVAAMQASIQGTTRLRSTPPPPPSSHHHDDAEIQLWKDRAHALDRRVSELEAATLEQTAKVDELSDRLALANERLAAETRAREQLEEQLAAGSSRTEEDEEMQAKATFEIAELRKQLGNAKESLRHRDEDLGEATQNLDMVTAQLEQLREGYEADQKAVKEQVQQWKTTAENFSKQVNELTKANAALTESRDSALSLVADHERALADALAAFAH